jgi:hypothetical protein
MNDPKEIAEGIVTKYWPFGDLDKLKALFEKDIAAAIQAERDARSCARNQRTTQFCAEAVAVHAELERVKAERDEAVKLLRPFAACVERTTEFPNACRAARAFMEKVKQ